MALLYCRYSLRSLKNVVNKHDELLIKYFFCSIIKENYIGGENTKEGFKWHMNIK